MVLHNKFQDKSCIIQDAQALLAELKQVTGEKNPYIAEQIGVDPATIWGVEKGRPVSKQLKTGLKLLLENLKMRERLDQIEQAQRTLTALAMPTAPFLANEEARNPKPTTRSNDPAQRVIYGKPPGGFKSGVNSARKKEIERQMMAALKKGTSPPPDPE